MPAFQLFLLPLAALAAASIPATSPLLLWQGRTERDVAHGRVSFDWLSVSATFTVTNSATVWAVLNSTFWASPPTGRDLGPAHRDLQQAQFPKFGVYRTFINGTRLQSGLEGVVVQKGDAEYLIADGLDPMQNHTIALWYTTDAVFNSWHLTWGWDAGRRWCRCALMGTLRRPRRRARGTCSF